MTASLPISALEIIGYASRLTETMRPAVVPPVFRVKAEPERILLPPFVIQDGAVWGATQKTAMDLQRLDEAGEVTLIEPVRPALRDHELWITEEGSIRYEPIGNAEAQLQETARQHIAAAVRALEQGKDDEALDHCRTALCADDRFLEPLAIRAGIARRQRDPGAERLMAKLAGNRATEAGFMHLVNAYAGMAPQPVLQLEPNSPAMHSMSGMAARKAA